MHSSITIGTNMASQELLYRYKDDFLTDFLNRHDKVGRGTIGKTIFFIVLQTSGELFEHVCLSHSC